MVECRYWWRDEGQRGSGAGRPAQGAWKNPGLGQRRPQPGVRPRGQLLGLIRTRSRQPPGQIRVTQTAAPQTPQQRRITANKR